MTEKLTPEDWKEILRDYELGRTGIAPENVQRVLNYIAALEAEVVQLKEDREALLDALGPFGVRGNICEAERPDESCDHCVRSHYCAIHKAASLVASMRGTDGEAK